MFLREERGSSFPKNYKRSYKVSYCCFNCNCCSCVHPYRQKNPTNYQSSLNKRVRTNESIGSSNLTATQNGKRVQTVSEEATLHILKWQIKKNQFVLKPMIALSFLRGAISPTNNTTIKKRKFKEIVGGFSYMIAQVNFFYLFIFFFTSSLSMYLFSFFFKNFCTYLCLVDVYVLGWV